jgi:hypothetical protein
MKSQTAKRQKLDESAVVKIECVDPSVKFEPFSETIKTEPNHPADAMTINPEPAIKDEIIQIPAWEVRERKYRPVCHISNFYLCSGHLIFLLTTAVPNMVLRTLLCFLHTLIISLSAFYFELKNTLSILCAEKQKYTTKTECIFLIWT